jgi:hypothetical protein
MMRLETLFRPLLDAPDRGINLLVIPSLCLSLSLTLSRFLPPPPPFLLSQRGKERLSVVGMLLNSCRASGSPSSTVSLLQSPLPCVCVCVCVCNEACCAHTRMHTHTHTHTHTCTHTNTQTHTHRHTHTHVSSCTRTHDFKYEYCDLFVFKLYAVCSICNILSKSNPVSRRVFEKRKT